MKIQAKKLVDKHGKVWVVLYSDGGLSDPFALINKEDAQFLHTQIETALWNDTEIPQ